MMIAKWRYVWWPLAAINSFRVALRDRLFDLGVWKSVAFEVPIVYVGSLTGEPTIAISRYVQQLLKGALHVDRFRITKYQLEKQNQTPASYYIPLSAENVFCSTQKVLGLSEWYQDNSDTAAFVMDNEFARNEIRPKYKLLITDYCRPFINDAMAPVGSLQVSKEKARLADVVLVCNTPINEDYKKIEKAILLFLKEGIPVFFVKNSFNSLNALNSSEEIEFISDRSNFDRLILNILPNANPDSE